MYNYLYWNSCRFCFITVSSLPVRPSWLWSEYFFHHWYSTFFLNASVLVLVFAAVTLECPCIELTMFILRAFLWSQLCCAKHLEYIGLIGIQCAHTLLLCSRVYCRNRIIKNNSAWLHCCLFYELRGTPRGERHKYSKSYWNILHSLTRNGLTSLCRQTSNIFIYMVNLIASPHIFFYPYICFYPYIILISVWSSYDYTFQTFSVCTYHF